VSRLSRPAEDEALAMLDHCYQTGAAAGAIPAHVAESLLSNRLAETDDYGSLRVTERGRHYLHDLRAEHAIRRAGRPTGRAR
jgi:hypothetical protein